MSNNDRVCVGRVLELTSELTSIMSDFPIDKQMRLEELTCEIEIMALHEYQEIYRRELYERKEQLSTCQD